MIYLQAKEWQRLPAPNQGKEDARGSLPLELSVRAWPFQHFDVRLLGFIAMRK